MSTPHVYTAPSWRLIVRVLALICFIIAVIVALGDATFKWEAALIPGGLGLWLLSEL